MYTYINTHIPSYTHAYTVHMYLELHTVVKACSVYTMFAELKVNLDLCCDNTADIQ